MMGSPPMTAPVLATPAHHPTADRPPRSPHKPHVPPPAPEARTSSPSPTRERLSSAGPSAAGKRADKPVPAPLTDVDGDLEMDVDAGVTRPSTDMGEVGRGLDPFAYDSKAFEAENDGAGTSASNENGDEAVDAVDEQEQARIAAGVSTLPLSRIKRIMTEDKDVGAVAGEAVLATAHATELFLEMLASKAYNYSRRDRRKQLAYKDVASAVADIDEFEFLIDTVPQMVSLKKALAKQKYIQQG